MIDLRKIVELQKQGQAVGIYSACTGNRMVLEACMQHANKTHTVLLIEATANQVDQYGGYTGMRPADFVQMIHELSGKTGLPMERVILGGDHLGPLTFAKLPEREAMREARELIHSYVLAGFTKIHVDTSMKVADDPAEERLSDAVIAKRGADLVKVAEEAWQLRKEQVPDAPHPFYIVGSEVPIPGGSQEAVDAGVQVTRPEDFRITVEAFRQAFSEAGVADSWPYVIGVVVQPGVEEKDAGCTEYNREAAKELMTAIREYPNLVFEGHSTDYQTRFKLRELVEDGVGILKVGPALTFALREGIYALAYAEKERYRVHPEEQSYFIEVLDAAMQENPGYYEKHYHGTSEEVALKRRFSFSDRSRYYMGHPKVQAALEKLLAHFRDGVPLNLLNQFMPVQYAKVREGKLENIPEALVYDWVAETIDDYLYATRQELLG